MTRYQQRVKLLHFISSSRVLSMPFVNEGTFTWTFHIAPAPRILQTPKLIVSLFGTCGSTHEGAKGMSVVAECHEDARGAEMQLQQLYPLGQ
jgi:hypothetical protein